jgi:DNA-binding MarR family transcriptional regulator
MMGAGGRLMSMETSQDPATARADTAFTDALITLAGHVDHVFGEVGRDAGLTPQQAHLICQIVEGPVGMAGLGRLLHLEKSSVTGLVDRIERRGLVTRVRDERDRRAYKVALTDDGMLLATKIHKLVTERLDRLAETLPLSDREVLVSAITRMLAPTR